MPLPDEVQDNDEIAAEELPPTPHQVLNRCCQQNCLAAAEVRAEQHRWEDERHSAHECRGELFRRIRGSSNKRVSHKQTKHYQYFSTMVCRAAFLKLWDISNGKLTDWAKHAVIGSTEPPADLRKARPLRPGDRSAWKVADQFWLWVYYQVGESLAEGEQELHHLDALWESVSPGADVCVSESTGITDDGEAGLSASSLAIKPETAPRHLPPLEWVEIFTLFDAWREDVDHCSDDVKCGHQTVEREYYRSWQKALPFRGESTHSKCHECTEFKLLRRRTSQSNPDFQLLTDAYVRHIHDQARDRIVRGRIEVIAKENLMTSGPPSDPATDLLNYTIDAMEQAKFKAPRHEGSKPKEAAAYWRPQLHVTGTSC